MNATIVAAAKKSACVVILLLSALGCRAEVSRAAALRELSLGFADSQTHAVMIIVQERECLSRESDLGIAATPVVVVRSATSGSLMVFAASANRRILRRQLLAVQTLIED